MGVMLAVGRVSHDERGYPVIRGLGRVQDRLRRLIEESEVARSMDLDLERQLQARASTVAFIDEHMPHLTGHRGRDPLDAKLKLLQWAVAQAPHGGLAAEFGVASGMTLRTVAAIRSPVHGFDSFEGLPENWRAGYEVGAFAQEVPDVEGAELHVGRFDETLPTFLVAHPEPFDFVHMDADLYSSTRTVLDLAAERFVPGTVIVFDEYFNYPGWQEHEHKAFTEFCQRYGGGFEYLGYNAQHEQVVVRMT